MKKITALLAVALILVIVAVTAGCQSSPAAVVGEVVSANNVPPDTPVTEKGESTRQIEFNGVIVTIPSDWLVEDSSRDGWKVIRLIYSGADSWGGPWIEISPAAEPLTSSRSVSAASVAGDEVVIFRNIGIRSAGGCKVDTAYIPAKNVMVSAGYMTAEQCDMISNIFCSIQLAD